MVGGRYELRAVLGRGGMGAVWLAQDDLLRREVAVKEILWPSQLDDSEREILRQRALREARMAARLSHPNIIRVFDVVDEDGSPWIVMELARYPSLRTVIEE
jgi:eukaryotic-like serine/threonine-protein kinase